MMDATKSTFKKRRRAPRFLEDEQFKSAVEYRVLAQPAFVLHRYPYSETSVIIDAMTQDYGRVALLAKGAKRPHSALRAILQSFVPLSLSWSGKGELKTLIKAEWVGGMQPIHGEALLSGFYLNELLVKFFAREDPHPQLFQHYSDSLSRLANQEAMMPVLRFFEKTLLRETGYALILNQTIDDQWVEPELRYVVDPHQGVRLADETAPSDWPVLFGQTLLDIDQDRYISVQTIAESKVLMRFLLHAYLGGVPLATRQILIDLHNL